MGLKGNRAGLDKMRARCARIKSGRAATEAARDLASEALALSKADASSGVAPSGRAWKPLKHKGGAPLAWASGTLSVEVAGKRVQLTSSARFSIFHQRGAPGIGLPKRQILPSKAIPRRWKAALMARARRRFLGIF